MKTDQFNFHNFKTQDLRTSYDANGIIYLKNILSREKLTSIKQDMIFAETNALDEFHHSLEVDPICFYTNNPKNQKKLENAENFVLNEYFYNSDSKAHVFFEEIDGALKINRLGHGLHRLDEYKNTKDFIYENDSLNKVLKSIGYKAPICLLSAYIPKLPRNIGSKVKPHQESTFAHTDPLSSGVLWVALEDARIDNACMWGILKSHKYPLKYISKVDLKKSQRNYEKINDFNFPEFDESVYTPLEVVAGDALFFHGNFVHCSPTNHSESSRKAITFQFIETEGTKFSEFNWIQNPNSTPLYMGGLDE